MNTMLATPEEPDDRCSECRSTFKMHLEFPYGINYVKLRPITERWIRDESELVTYENSLMDIQTCYAFKQGL